jgi:hypothetical protein
LATEEKSVTAVKATAVTPTTATMPAKAVTPEVAGTPASAQEFCRDSTKKSFKWRKLILLFLV